MKTILSILMLVMLCGCASNPSLDAINPLKLDPPLGGAAPKLEFSGGQTGIEPSPPPVWLLVWDYESELPTIGVEFDVETTDDPAHPWVLYCRTNQPPVPYSPTNGSGYYRVGAHFTDSFNQ